MRDGSRHVFVGGLHRSGTTPLARVLADHPEISGLTGTGVSEDEGQHLQSVYPRIRAYGGMGRFAMADAAHLTAQSPLVSAQSAQRLFDSWSPYWDLDRRLLLEKSPSNLIKGGFLEATFPGSALIVVIRHPLAVSLAMQKWNPALFARNGRRRTSLPGLVAHWLRAHQILAADAAALPRLLVLRYEDLIAQPEARLAEVERFLGLASALDAGGFRRGLSDPYQHRWDEMAHGNPLARRARAVVTDRFAGPVRAYGYELDRIGEVVGPLVFPQEADDEAL